MNRTELGFDASGSQSGVPAGLAFDPSTGLFGLVTTDAGLFYVQDDFKTVVSHGLVDSINGNDITTTVDATFVGPDTLVAMASNKTIYGAQRLDGQSPNEADVWKEYRETSGDLEPVFGVKGRPMLRTARAKKAYALSLAADQDSQEIFVVSVPHEGNPKIVVSKFAADNMLSSEGVLKAGNGADVDVSAYYPVGADFADGNLYLLSKMFNSVLTVDPVTFEVTAVHGLPEVGDPSDITVTEQGVFILARDGDTDVVYQLDGLN